MASRGPKIPGARFSEKKNVFFLNFIGPVTPPWVLYPPEIMHMGSTGLFLARAVFEKSIKLLGWQPGAPKSREHHFPTKKNVLLFLNFIGPVTPHGFCIPLKPCIWARRNLYWPEQCLQSKLKCLDGSQGPQNSGSTIFRKKKRHIFFEIHRTSDTSMGSVSL